MTELANRGRKNREMMNAGKGERGNEREIPENAKIQQEKKGK